MALEEFGVQAITQGFDKFTSDFGKANQAMETASSTAETISGKMQKVGLGLGAVGAGLSIGLTRPIVDFGKEAVTAASDVSESLNAVNVVFGTSSSTITDWGKNASTQAGLAQKDYLQLAAVSGAALQNLGLSQDDAAAATIKLTQRAADMASIFNTDVDEALGAIQAGLRGEADPLERFGVRLNASAVAAKAVALGLAESTSEVTDAARAQASLALLFEQTDKLAGDFVNTSDGLANSQRIVAAQFEDVKATLGQALLPIIQQATGFVRDLLTRFQGLSPEMQKTIVIVGAVVAAVGPLLVVLGAFIGALGTVIPVVTAVAGVLTFPLIAIIAAVGLTIAALALAWKNNWFGIRDTVDTVTKVIKNIFSAFSKLFKGDFEGFADDIEQAWRIAWDHIREKISDVITTIRGKIGEFVQAGKDMIAGLLSGLQSAWVGVKTWIQQRIADIPKWVRDLLGISSPSEVFARIGRDIVNGLKLGIFENFKSLRDGLLLKLSELQDEMLEAIEEGNEKAIERIGQQISEIEQQLVDASQNLFDALVEASSGIPGALSILDFASGFSSLGSTAANLFQKRVLDPLAEKVEGAQDRVTGLWDGLIEKLSDSSRKSENENTRSFLDGLIERLERGEISLDDLVAQLSQGGILAQGEFSAVLTLIRQIQVAQSEATKATEAWNVENEKALELQRQQENLTFLRQQIELLDLIREHGLDANKILGGLKLGIDADLGAVIEAMTRAMSGLIDAAEDELGIASDSKKFRDIGKNIMSAISTGVMQTIKSPVNAVTSAMNRLIASSTVTAPAVAAAHTTNVNFNAGGVNINNGMDAAVFKILVRQAIREGLS